MSENLTKHIDTYGDAPQYSREKLEIKTGLDLSDNCDHEVSTEKFEAVREYVNNTREFESVVDAFKHLSDLTRVRIFWVLCHCKLCTTHLAEMLNMSPPAVAHHIRLLREANLIESERDGREVYYFASSIPEAVALHEAIENMIKLTCPVCD